MFFVELFDSPLKSKSDVRFDKEVNLGELFFQEIYSLVSSRGLK